MKDIHASGLDLSINALFSLGLECKKHDLLISRKIMQQALYVTKEKDGPVKRNLQRINNELKSKIIKKKKELVYDENEIFVFAPHLLPTTISSHKYLYLAWIERVFFVNPEANITMFITHEGGHSDNKFSQDFFAENLPCSKINSFKLITFPRYLDEDIDFESTLFTHIRCKPKFSLFFETVETYKTNYILSTVRNFSSCLSVHCNPKLPVNSLVDISFVGHETRALGAAKFLPVIVNEKRKFDSSFKVKKIDSSRKVIVTAFTNKRIIKSLIENASLKDAIIQYLADNEVEWHFIGHESKQDFFDLDERFFKIKDKFTVYPVTANLTEYYSQCDVYAYLPGFHGGDAGTKLAVEVGLPCIAMRDELGGYVKYATEELVCNDLTSYFEMLDRVIKEAPFYSEVVTVQKKYIEALHDTKNHDIFSTFVSEAIDSYLLRID